jgi:type IV pilus assembly protein PilN
MTRINLTPWREERRAVQERQFRGVLVAAALLAVVIVGGGHFYITGLLNHQEARNQMLRNEIARIARVEQEIREMERTEARLISRLEAIRGLQQSRPDKVVALDTFVRLVPADVYILSLQMRDNNFTLRGNARFNNTVSDFMREFEQTPVFNDPTLRVIQNQRVADNVPVSNFELTVSQHGGARP